MVTISFWNQYFGAAEKEAARGVGGILVIFGNCLECDCFFTSSFPERDYFVEFDHRVHGCDDDGAQDAVRNVREGRHE